VPRFRLDVTAINRLGWRARYNSEEAVALAIEATLDITTNHSHGERSSPSEAACRP
jgi:hypothetical protein